MRIEHPIALGLKELLANGKAFALQRLVVSYPCRGALAEVVENERTALVMEPNGKEFAAAMLRLINDETQRKKLGEAGRHEVEKRFSATRMVESTIRVYEDVLKKRKMA